MSNRSKSIVVRWSVIGASLAMLAACETTSPYSTNGKVEAKSTPNFPTRLDTSAPNATVVATAPAQPVAPPPVAAPPPRAPEVIPAPARPSGTVESQPLAPLAPPPAPAQPQPQAVAVAPTPPPPARVTPPAPPAPTFREIATGPVVDTDGPPATHTVKKGETLSSISRSMDISVKDLQTLNKLGRSSTIHPGQRLKGPATKAKAYVVQQGDTLAAIGRRFNVTTAQLTRSNGLPANASIRPSQRLILPSGYRDGGPQRIEIAATAAPIAPAAVAPPVRVSPPPVAAAQPSALAVSPPPRAAANVPSALSSGTSSRTRGPFIWPVEGRVINSFGPRGPGQRGDGIDIAAAEGADVKAVAAGTVSFVGGLEDSPDLGTLMVVENGSGYFSIYGHLASTDMTRGQRITQGQTIGRVGRTGVVTEPELYFELRHQDKPTDLLIPVDPIGLLPPR